MGGPWHGHRHRISFLLPRTVLELGSGAGFTGLAICKMCHPKAYIFSDCHSRVLEQLRGNVLLNDLSLEPDATTDAERPLVTVAQLDWEVATVTELSAFQPDIIIAAGNGQSAGSRSREASQELPGPLGDIRA